MQRHREQQGRRPLLKKFGTQRIFEQEGTVDGDGNNGGEPSRKTTGGRECVRWREGGRVGGRAREGGRKGEEEEEREREGGSAGGWQAGRQGRGR
jgi:hypothetical protein